MADTVRHDPGLAASPRVWHTLEVERGGSRAPHSRSVRAPPANGGAPDTERKWLRACQVFCEPALAVDRLRQIVRSLGPRSPHPQAQVRRPRAVNHTPCILKPPRALREPRDGPSPQAVCSPMRTGSLLARAGDRLPVRCFRPLRVGRIRRTGRIMLGCQHDPSTAARQYRGRPLPGRGTVEQAGSDGGSPGGGPKRAVPAGTTKRHEVEGSEGVLGPMRRPPS
jgi:hypothetical protein